MELKYIKNREKGLKQLFKLIEERNKLNKKIKEVEVNLRCWDMALLNNKK